MRNHGKIWRGKQRLWSNGNYLGLVCLALCDFVFQEMRMTLVSGWCHPGVETLWLGAEERVEKKEYFSTFCCVLKHKGPLVWKVTHSLTGFQCFYDDICIFICPAPGPNPACAEQVHQGLHTSLVSTLSFVPRWHSTRRLPRLPQQCWWQSALYI